jgi:hypothetical protein
VRQSISFAQIIRHSDFASNLNLLGQRIGYIICVTSPATTGCSKRSSFFENFLSLCYYKSYGFMIFAILRAIWAFGCTAVVRISAENEIAKRAASGPLTALNSATCGEALLTASCYSGLFRWDLSIGCHVVTGCLKENVAIEIL